MNLLHLADHDIRLYTDRARKGESGAAATRDDHFAPGVLSHQKALGRLLGLQQKTRRDRLADLAAEHESLGPTVRNRLAGNTVAYRMFRQSSDARAVALNWAEAADAIKASTSEDGDTEASPRSHTRSWAIIKHPNYWQGEYNLVSPPWFELDQIPERELQTRLGRGEIAPRDEWIPSDDPMNRKVIGTAEADSRLAFADKLKKEAAEEMGRLNVARANVLYTQGCNLLKHYVVEDKAKDIEMEETLLIFRRNKAVTHLKLREYRQCISIADEGLLFAPNDGKLQYLRARALQQVGDLDGAIAVFTNMANNGFIDELHRKAGRVALQAVITEQRTSDLKAGKVVKNYSTAADDLIKSYTQPKQVQTGHREKPPPVASLDIAPPMDPNLFLQLLKDLGLRYTTPDILRTLDLIRHEAGYDEKQIILGMRRFLPAISDPIFESYQIGGSCYEERKKRYDELVYIFSVSSHVDPALKAQIKMHLDHLRAVVFGTVADS